MNTPLQRLKFLAIDCQATGNSPKTSSLLEIGWLVFTLGAVSKPRSLTSQTFLLAQPKEAEIPSHVQKLTGIAPNDLEHAVSARHALNALSKQAGALARQNQRTLTPAVIHYARYEVPFLKELQRSVKTSAPLPIEVICTHQIAARLMSELPRKGLRAVAGYLGHSVPPLKRCAPHLSATAFIWCQLVQRLATQAGIHTLEQLLAWLKQPAAPSSGKIYPMPRQVRLGLPTAPGIYRMKRCNGDVLYIGKARSLKQRVNSYFHKHRRHPEHTLEMLTQAVALDFTRTNSAVAAALAESDAIKACDPPYNIALTKGHRKLSFISRDLGHHSATPNGHCRLGPVPSQDIFAAAHALGMRMDNGLDLPDDIPQMMALPVKHCPDAACFSSGLTLFEKTYGTLFDNMPPGQAVLRIGRWSWADRRRNAGALNNDMDEESAEDPGADPPSRVWTPEAVAKTLESICRRCGFLLRRARWFCILSESVVMWRLKNPKKGFNALVLNNGRIYNSVQIDPGAPIPEPPAGPNSWADRKSLIDLETYDRLRVLTTEIRRLLWEERFTCIRLNKRALLYPEQIRRLLNWL